MDELKEAKAHAQRLANGTTTRAKETAETMGVDYDTVHRENVRDKKRRIRDGLEVEAGEGSAVAPGDAPGGDK